MAALDMGMMENHQPILRNPPVSMNGATRIEDSAHRCVMRVIGFWMSLIKILSFSV